MHIFDKETLEKIKILPAEKRQKVIDGLAKMLAVRPHRFEGEPQDPDSRKDAYDVRCQRQG